MTDDMSQNSADTTPTNRRESIRDCLFALLSLWFTTIILHAIFISQYYNTPSSPSSTSRAPTRISIPCIYLDNSTVPIPEKEPCTTEYTAVSTDAEDAAMDMVMLAILFGILWIGSLCAAFCCLDTLLDEDAFKPNFMAIGSGLLGLVWVMIEPFGWEERNARAYIESFLLPVVLVLSVAISKEVWRTYRPLPHAEEVTGTETDGGRRGSTGMTETATAHQERRYGDLEAGRVWRSAPSD